MYRSLILFLVIGVFAVSCRVAAAEPAYDFRIVIDVSGSMKKTDPQNLRVPALKLLNGLIPTGSKAGVWTFSRYVDMSVKWGSVDEAWRKLADLGADKIHSNGLLTNIESALARASVGWDRPGNKTQRILLLLTDGQVDVSIHAEKNAASRSRVLGDSLARLKKAGVKIHSIALSGSTDEVLLKQLALETSGSFAVAENASELQKVFFKMFERASEPDTVAFNGSEFPIDGSIKEMTLLIFHDEGGQPTILIPPDSPAISAQKPRSARWRNDTGYDLITIQHPESGIWRIDADMDQDNRLMVVTDLRLEVGDLPAYTNPRDAIKVVAELFNRDKKITKNSFLRFVDFKLTHINTEGGENEYVLEHSSQRDEKGQYQHELLRKLAEGSHSFVVSADSRTFNRSKRFNLEVQWPVEVKIDAGEGPGIYQLMVRAREEYLKPDGLVAEVEIEAPDGNRDALAMTLSEGWLQARVETRQDGLYQAHIKISGQSNAAEITDLDLGAFSMLGVFREPLLADTEEVAAEPVLGEASEKEPEISWRFVGIIIVSVNLFLILALFVGWLVMRRKSATSELLLEDEEVSA
jgi:uncharacterized protein (TIGR03503 family)